MSPPRLLLISPGFHGYWRSIAAAFNRAGFQTRTHVYDKAGPTARVRDKLTYELPQRLGRRPTEHSAQTTAAVQALRAGPVDAVLLIKGDTLGAAFWAELERIPRRALWLYDELRRTQHTKATLDLAGPIASYSPVDVKTLRDRGYEAIHVPLAYDSRLGFRPRPTSEVVFVGARYPNREVLLRHLFQDGLPVRVYGRDWSDHPADRLRTWRLRSSHLPNGRDLTRSEAYATMAGAAATLNIHGDQDGFTMRTFEAAGIGGVQLVDRHDVADFYEPGKEVLVFDSPEHAAEVLRRVQRDQQLAETVRTAAAARTLAEHTFDHRTVRLLAMLK